MRRIIERVVTVVTTTTWTITWQDDALHATLDLILNKKFYLPLKQMKQRRLIHSYRKQKQFQRRMNHHKTLILINQKSKGMKK